MAESIKFFEIKGMGKPRGKAFDRKMRVWLRFTIIENLKRLGGGRFELTDT